MLLLDEIKYYRDIGVKIDVLVKNYYNEVIVCNSTYEFLSWELLENNEIMINYSCIDYNDKRWYDDVTVTIEQLNEYV
jgi:hypothetical protein